MDREKGDCMPAAALAARTGVAPGTVRNFLADYQRQGWLQPEGDRNRLRLQTAFAQASLRWIALEFEWMDVLARCA